MTKPKCPSGKIEISVHIYDVPNSDDVIWYYNYISATDFNLGTPSDVGEIEFKFDKTTRETHKFISPEVKEKDLYKDITTYKPTYTDHSVTIYDTQENFATVGSITLRAEKKSGNGDSAGIVLISDPEVTNTGTQW